MIVDYNTMPRMFREFNRKYFNRSLPTPKFGLLNKLHTMARFCFNKDKKRQTPHQRQEIQFTNCYDFEENVFRMIMVHEMIHYYIKWNGIKDNGRAWEGVYEKYQ